MECIFVMIKVHVVFQACTDKVDCILFLFSLVDKSSFDELHALISRLSTPNNNVAKLVIATKYPLHAASYLFIMYTNVHHYDY